MNERLKFIVAMQGELYKFSELCDRYGISRKTGYKWARRYAEEGLDGLKERSRAPLHIPHRMSPEAASAIIQAKKLHPSWGPKKLLPWIGKRDSNLNLPSVTAAGNLLAQEGLVVKSRRRIRRKHPGRPISVPTGANDIWAADFKGDFRMGDSRKCFPLTVTDLHSRYIIGCKALLSTRGRGVKSTFKKFFRQYGLPLTIRTDNGNPFVSSGIHGLSRLNVWWMKLGIVHERIEPGRPDQNGCHERMHRTLKAETTRPPEKNSKKQQTRFDRFREEFNNERPHEALNQETPVEHWQSSPRPYREKASPPEYPGYFSVRLVSNVGTLRFKHKRLFISEALEHEHVGLEEIDDGIWSVYFYDTLLGKFDERDWKFYD